MVQCTAVIASQAASQERTVAGWQVAVPAVVGALVLLAVLFAAFKLTPRILEDMALLRMVKLKRG